MSTRLTRIGVQPPRARSRVPNTAIEALDDQLDNELDGADYAASRVGTAADQFSGSEFDGEFDSEFDSEFDDDFDNDRRSLRRTIEATPKTAMAICAVALICVVVAALMWTRGGETHTPYPVVDFNATANASDTAAAGAENSENRSASTSVATPPAAQTSIVVSIVGLVRKPGLHTLHTGTRVGQALTVAGGALPLADTVSINLAQILNDGDQILVGTRSAAGGLEMKSAVVSGSAQTSQAPLASPSAGGVGQTATLISINSASAAELDALPGVGPATAAAIVQYRTEHGSFTSIDQLAEVSGIGPAKLAKIRAVVTL